MSLATVVDPGATRLNCEVEKAAWIVGVYESFG